MKKNICVAIFLLMGSILTAQNYYQYINTNWQFKQSNFNEWHAASVPGTIHTDLLNNNLIPDPFYRNNETKLQWISQTDWEYKTTFNIDEAILSKNHVDLIFEGLDTYADVYLNHQKILTANNMFRTWKVNIKNLLQKNQNELYIVFKSVDKMADSLAQASPLLHPCENNRNYVRKAQYNFGWDFAPKLTTCGIWRNIELQAWDYFSKAEIKNIIDTTSQKNTNKIIKLVQQKDAIGQSFYFTLNNKPLFIKGANWVPADVFLPRVTKEKYRNLLIAAKEAGINMLRVWGGGIYEDDNFYDLCDSLQIMVWQDFMFAGAMYPTSDTAFLQNIVQEIKDNLQRIAHHKCIVVWCGNNEIDEAWKNWGWQKQFKLSSADSLKLWNSYYYFFHEILPSLVKKYSKQPYITTSPLYGWGKKESMTSADSHYWGVWWGLEPISNYKIKIPRFMSEYGMQALPNLESILNFALKSDLDTASSVMKVHQKHATGYQNITTYLKQNHLSASNFQQYINASQALQSIALETAIKAHLKAQPKCMGTMFWQFNDCWPGVSWSIIDYYGKKKKGYYTVKKLFTAK